MFVVEETFLALNPYTFQTDFYTKVGFCFLGVILFFEILRNQISEIDLLQLVPGFYFLLFFIFFLVLIFVSENFFRLVLEIDNLNGSGTKVTTKMDLNILFKFIFFSLSSLLGISLNSIIPLSLDSFNYSGEKTLENIWSLNEVVFLEIILLSILIIISQIPVFFLINFNSQKIINLVSNYWKILIVCMMIISGFLTPTLDGYTQINFAASAFLFYLVIINFLQKRLLLKLNFFSFFGS
jgi:hypothetical protein